MNNENEVNFSGLLERIFEEFRNVSEPLHVETMEDSIWASSTAASIIGHEHRWFVLTDHRKQSLCRMLELVADENSATRPIGDEKRHVIWSAHTNFTTHGYDETAHQGMWFGDHSDSRVSNGFRNAENPNLTLILQIERRISCLVRELKQPNDSELMVAQKVVPEALLFRRSPEDTILVDSRRVLERGARLPQTLDPMVLQELGFVSSHVALAGVSV